MSVADALNAADGPQPPPVRKIEFLTPSAAREFVAPEGWNLVGDYHIQRSSVFVIGGAPGVGKSRVVTTLAAGGAYGTGEWLGLKVHCPFKTMILQAENGRIRLREEYKSLSNPSFDDFIRVCPPPPFGFAFDDPEFVSQLREEVEAFGPDVFIVDPWNRATSDDKSKDYLATFQMLQGILPKGEKAPALGIVAHTRKPQAGERTNGRSLLNVLAGGYALGSVPRSAFVLQHASDDPEETRVVFTCCKNNDGELGKATAWTRGNGVFVPVEDFDWNEFNAPPEKRRSVTVADLEAVFADEDGGPGYKPLSRKEAVACLEEETGCSKAACYLALKVDGKFKGRIKEKSGLLTLS